jgi:hypothetical protein
LPTATAGALVAITALNTVTGATPVTVTGAASSIFGIGMGGVTSFSLGTAGSYAVLQSDGTHWYVIAGGQDSGWVAVTLATNIGQIAGSYVPAARLRGDRVELAGGVQNNTGVAITAATIATIPAGLRPASTVQVAPPCGNGSGTVQLSVSTAGALAVVGTSPAFPTGATDGLYLDQCGYRIV